MIEHLFDEPCSLEPLPPDQDVQTPPTRPHDSQRVETPLALKAVSLPIVYCWWVKDRFYLRVVTALGFKTFDVTDIAATEVHPFSGIFKLGATNYDPGTDDD